MLGLTLREEFRGKRLKGTAIELSNDQHTGATQIAARQFLEITYPAILLFQDAYQGDDAALVFWLPGGGNRIRVQAATDEVCWLCHTPHGHQIEFGRILWGQANEYPQEILLSDGGRPAGLFHLRIT